MLSFFFFSFFLSFILFYLEYRFFSFLGISSFLWLVLAFFLWRKKIHFFSLLVGVAFGFSYTLYIKNSFLFSYIPSSSFEGEVKLLQVSRASLVLEGEKEGKKFRFRLLYPQKKDFYRGDILFIKCIPKKAPPKGSFAILESLYGVSFYCIHKEEKLIKPFPLGRDIRIFFLSLIEKRLSFLRDISLAKGFLLADTSSIPSPALDSFRKMGISHLFSTSVLHLGLIFVMVFRSL